MSGEFRVEEARAFLAAIPPGAQVALVMDGDADGLSAGRIVAAALQARGASVAPVFPLRGEHGFSPAVAERVRAAAPSHVVLVDTGASAENPLAPLPVLVLDHHRPLGGTPPGTVYCSSYSRKPTENSSLIAWIVCRDLADLRVLDWVVLVGVFGDLGSADAFPELAESVSRHPGTALKRCVSLLNAARRSAACDPATAWEALVRAQSPKDLSRGSTPAVTRLRGYYEDLRVAMDVSFRAAPKFGGRNALVRIDTPCLIHGILASRWVNRLPGYRVIVANAGYLPGRVVFSMRTAQQESLIQYLNEQSAGLDLEGGRLGYGHDRATGGIVPPAAFAELLRRMGFEEERY